MLPEKPLLASDPHSADVGFVHMVLILSRDIERNVYWAGPLPDAGQPQNEGA
jgi:hypothetical protein